MKKIKRSSELLWLLGIIFVAFGVMICSKANLGVSMVAAPAFVISEWLSHFHPFFTVGVTEYLIQGIILIVLCLVLRRFNWRYLLAFAVAVIYGYTLDLFMFLFSGVAFEPIWLRWVMLIVGDLFTGIGVACFFRTYMPLQVYELFVSELSSGFKIDIKKVKQIFDYSLLVISVTLALVLFLDVADFNWLSIGYNCFHSIGLGTIVTTIINAPIINGMGKIVDLLFEPTALFPALENKLKIK